MRWPPPIPSLSLLLACALLGACRPRAPQRRERDPTLSTLDRLIERGAPAARDLPTAKRCIDEADARGACTANGGRRTFKLHVALDQRYVTRWPNARARLAATMRCANRLYATTGIRFVIDKLEPWDPGAERHSLYPLLGRLRRERPADGRHLVLGITVWDKRYVYRLAGGEIGLSQGAHCVVPSWPRVENDCVILAHELGHLTGAIHVPGKSWVMGWAARPFYLPAQDALARVVATYRFHPRNVAALRAFRRGKLSKSGLRAVGRCRERVERIDRCWRGKH